MLWRTLLTDICNNQSPAPNSCGTTFFDYVTRALARIFAFEEIQQAHVHHDPDQERRWQKMIRAWQGMLELESLESRFSWEDFEDRFSAAIEQKASSWEFINCRNFFSDFERDLRYSCAVRRLFGTAKGYLGIGAFSPQADDKVWVLGEANTPAILRKQSNGLYRLVDEAYVHGVMNGEAIRSVTQERLQRITLE